MSWLGQTIVRERKPISERTDYGWTDVQTDKSKTYNPLRYDEGIK